MKVSLVVGLVAAFVLVDFHVSATDAVLPLSAPVKVLPQTNAEQTSMAMQNPGIQRPRPQPTTPGGKLPQYQLGHHHRTIPTEAELHDPRLRLILALPSMPILIDAVITIDGEPYLMARERRIQQILEDAARPEPSVIEEPPQSATAQDENVTAVETAKTAETAEAAPASERKPDSEGIESESSDSGTSTPPDGDSASKDEPDSENRNETKSESEGADKEPKAEPVSPPTVPEYVLPATESERLRRFIAATGEAASADEVRWLLTNWVDGPVLLMLNDNFQRFRANQRPVFNVLDADRDGMISADELSNAVTAFEKCDFNRNDIVEYTELAKVAADPQSEKSQHAGPGKLIFRVPDEKSAVAMYRRMAARYPAAQADADPLLPRFDVNANGKFDPEELAVLREANPDLSFTITFNSADPTASRIEVTAAGSELAVDSTHEGAAADSISLPIGGTIVTFSAVQSGKSDQISIGAVNDGYPMLPVLDPNEDGRFTIRERRSLLKSLQAFDKNQDGRLSQEETQATIRICFGLGPHVHRELIALRQVNPKSETPVVAGPDWFVRMDRNRDNDISRKEFPGTEEHFRNLDADQDELVSVQEALDFDKRTSRPAADSLPAAEKTTENSTEKTTNETAIETE
ncbi:MAG: hypothetical protein HQ518_07460 [Rhodopirellula sp.]|nr:hypothetical protein [Rhodopirellula sp.]